MWALSHSLSEVQGSPDWMTSHFFLSLQIPLCISVDWDWNAFPIKCTIQTCLPYPAPPAQVFSHETLPGIIIAVSIDAAVVGLYSRFGLGRDVLLFRKLIIIFGKRLWATIGCLNVAIKCCMMAIGICLMKARICTICGPKLAEFTLRGQFWFCFCFANCFFDLYLIVFLILFQFLKIRTIFLLVIIINI